MANTHDDIPSTPLDPADAVPSRLEHAALTVRSEVLQVFSGITAFDQAQRMARALCSSSLVPREYQGQNGLANSLIALEIAARMGLSPLVVMQNMTPIHGRPTWSSKFLIATVNASGRFSPLRFVFDDKQNPSSCYAVATDKATGELLEGETITLELARKEGWLGRSGSKWQTMPGQMLRYRAASWWANVYCPEIALGLMTQEEALDIEPPALGVSPSSTEEEFTRRERPPEVIALSSGAQGAPQTAVVTDALAEAPADPDAPAVQGKEAPEAPANPAPSTETPAEQMAVAPVPTPAEQGQTTPKPGAAGKSSSPSALPVIAQLTEAAELDQVERQISALLASGEISDAKAERLWAAVDKRRDQLAPHPNRAGP